MTSTHFGRIHEQSSSAIRQRDPLHIGATIWLTGLPSAGKTTIATGLATILRDDGHAVQILDGDAVRAYLSADLGFSRADRFENVRRIGFVAGLLARHGVKVISAVVSPYAESRAAVRMEHEDAGTAFLEVYVATPLAICIDRDVKGLYAKQRNGILTGLTGVDDPYEPPTTPDLFVQTQNEDIRASVSAVHALLVDRGLA